MKIETMRLKPATATIFCILLFSATALSQQADSKIELAPNAPQDKPINAESSDEVKRLEEAIKPYIEKAKKTYPDARKRFLAGLPPKHAFFITTRLHDSQGHFEQVFIAVKEIKEGVIKGVIASEVRLVSGFKYGNSYSFPESELIDWTIAKPDGTEEGNFVGKFLDTYQVQSNNHESSDQAEEKVYQSSEVTRRAHITYKPEPPFTEEARQRGVYGKVVLRVILRASGEVTDITVVKGLPHGLTEQCIEKAKQMKFEPAMKDGRPVSQYFQTEYHFSIY